MPDYTLVNLVDVDDAAVAGGFSDVQEAHFATRDLGLAELGLSYQVVRPNRHHAFGHRHKEIEEVYVVVGGSGTCHLDDGEVPVKRLDAIRVAPDRDPRVRRERRGPRAPRLQPERTGGRGARGKVLRQLNRSDEIRLPHRSNRSRAIRRRNRMPRMLFPNLAVKDLDRAVGFFTGLGFTFDERFTDETATADDRQRATPS